MSWSLRPFNPVVLKVWVATQKWVAKLLKMGREYSTKKRKSLYHTEEKAEKPAPNRQRERERDHALPRWHACLWSVAKIASLCCLPFLLFHERVLERCASVLLRWTLLLILFYYSNFLISMMSAKMSPGCKNSLLTFSTMSLIGSFSAHLPFRLLDLWKSGHLDQLPWMFFCGFHNLSLRARVFSIDAYKSKVAKPTRTLSRIEPRFDNKRNRNSMYHVELKLEIC